MKLKDLFDRHIIYKSVLIVVTLISCTAIGHAVLAPYFRILLVWGMAAVLCDLARGRIRYRDPKVWALAAFCAMYGVSAYVNRANGFSRNIKDLLYMAVLFAVLYCTKAYDDRRKAMKEAALLSSVFMVCTALLTAGGLLTFLLGVDMTYVTADGITGYIGCSNGRLDGLVYTNTGSALCATSIMMSIGYMRSAIRDRIRISRKVRGMILPVLNVLLCGVYMILSYSRTSIYALAAAVACALILLSVSAGGWRAVCGSAAAILIAAVIVLGVSPAKEALWSFQGCVGGIEQEPAAAGAVSSSAVGESSFRDRLNRALSGRVDIWEAGLHIAGDNLIFGITNENITPEIKAIMPHEYYWEDGGVHSIYLNVILASGLAGAVCLAVFGVLSVRGLSADSWAVMNHPGAAFTGAMGVMLLYLIMELTESRILYRFNAFFVVFWITAAVIREEAE